MKKILSFVKAIVNKVIVTPVKWLWAKGKALVAKEEPVLKRAAANLPGEMQAARTSFKTFWAAFKAGWKAVRGWAWLTRLAFSLVLVALATIVFVAGHQMGHRKVPGLQHQVLDLSRTHDIDVATITRLKGDNEKLQAELTTARAAPVASANVTVPMKTHRAVRSVKKARPKSTSNDVMSAFGDLFN